MNSTNDIHSINVRQLKKSSTLSTDEEDYLEMIYRHAQVSGFVRINFLAARLNANPSAVSKMVLHLKELGLAEYEKYGLIYLTQTGSELGGYLLYRHNVIHKFLCLINDSFNELEQAEQIEHYFNKQTVQNIENLVENMEKNDKKTLNDNMFDVIL